MGKAGCRRAPCHHPVHVCTTGWQGSLLRGSIIDIDAIGPRLSSIGPRRRKTSPAPPPSRLAQQLTLFARKQNRSHASLACASNADSHARSRRIHPQLRRAAMHPFSHGKARKWRAGEKHAFPRAEGSINQIRKRCGGKKKKTPILTEPTLLDFRKLRIKTRDARRGPPHPSPAVAAI